MIRKLNFIYLVIGVVYSQSVDGKCLFILFYLTFDCQIISCQINIVLFNIVAFAKIHNNYYFLGFEQ